MGVRTRARWRCQRKSTIAPRVKRLLLLSLLLPAIAAAEAEPIAWSEAQSCTGRVCSVRGKVAEVRDDGTAIRLYFDPQRRDICVTLVRSWLVSWPDYAGQEIVANGPVRRFRDLTEVTVLAPSEITLAGVANEPAPANEVPAPEPATEPQAPEKEEVEALREEIQRLERRVNELEGR